MPAKLYARIHPDARNGSTPVRLYDVAGIQFTRGGGSYKGWYPVTDEQTEKLRRCHVANGNPNSMRVFQIEDVERVDEISAVEARSRMAPEQQRIDKARDNEIATLKKQLAALDPLLKLLGSPEGLTRLARIVTLDNASNGAALSQEDGDIATAVATAPPRREPMTELDIAHDEKRAPVATQAQPPARTENKPAPAPPARPGARPGAGAGKKDAKKDEPKPASNASSSLPASLPSDISAAMDAGAFDEDDDHDV